MPFKLMIILAFIAAVSAGVIIPTVPEFKTLPAVTPIVAQPILTKTHEVFDPHPQYKYTYDVHDILSGDSKSQFKERNGDVVRGEYSLIDADGFKRTVRYTADALNGFNAIVSRVPLVKTVLATGPVAAVAAVSVAPLTVESTAVAKTVPLHAAVDTTVVKEANH